MHDTQAENFSLSYKGEKMATKRNDYSDTDVANLIVTTTSLQDTVETQNQLITRLNARVSQLVDELHLIKSDIKRFKTHVGNDVKLLSQHLGG